MYTTDQYEGMIAETTAIHSDNGESILAYFARPTGPGPFPGVVLTHHAPGWSDWYKEWTRKFASIGYSAICPDLYGRVAQGTPEDVGARVRAEGGVPDAQVVGDLLGAVAFLKSLPTSNGKVGMIGSCSGGRHTFLAACQTDQLDAAVDLWGGGVVMAEADLTDKRPVSPVTMTKDLGCPLLGLFGNDDKTPSPEQVDIHEAALKEHGKEYEFHRYDGAGHGFFYQHFPAAYRAEAALDGWQKITAFFEKHLS